ncbi:hypothetical protein V6U90_29005 [Micromonospora sp. CPCC 206060]|uniref:hypothetical protein n=1 Tax=Micromonospora sp. CPCC 206060 TaxID=3122406 RepID=UPI002FF422F2
MTNRDRAAGTVGVAAGVLGIVAGTAAALWGHDLGAWAGDKQDPAPLGALTVVLAAVAVCVSAAQRQAARRRGLPPGHRAAVAAGQLIPALLGFTTVGRLWWIAGAALTATAALTISVAPAPLGRAVRQHWPAVLTSALGAFLALAGATAAVPLMTMAILSGALIAVAPWQVVRSRRLALLLLMAGSVPLATLTWRTVIMPLTAALALVTGTMALSHQHPTAHRPNPTAT